MSARSKLTQWSRRPIKRRRYTKARNNTFEVENDKDEVELPPPKSEGYARNPPKDLPDDDDILSDKHEVNHQIL